MTTTADTQRAESQARAQLESIIEMVKALNTPDDDDAYEAATEAIHEDPLSVEVRSGWTSPGAAMEPAEYCILRCTGGPAVRIIGDHGVSNEPESASLEYQDWGIPWIAYRLSAAQEEMILTYAQQFYFEG